VTRRSQRDPFEDMPLEVRRLNSGWFGPPWPSGVCYDNGRLLGEMRKPFPAGESCLFCVQPFDEVAGDAGQAMPYNGGVVHVHKECMLRQVTGPLAHLQGLCSCAGFTEPDWGMTAREEALAVWAWVHEHGVSPVRTDDARSITCPVCRMTSYNPVDVKEGFCGNCRRWIAPAARALPAEDP